jgi:hypothetical protein
MFLAQQSGKRPAQQPTECSVNRYLVGGLAFA